MADRFDRLEAELSSLRPAPVSERLVHEISVEASRWNFADRCLAGAMSLGAIAACVIGGMVIWQRIESAPASPTPSPSPVVQRNAPSRGPTLGQYQQSIAHGGGLTELY